MPSVNTQFHMLPGELIDFVVAVTARYSLSVELQRWFPKIVRKISTKGDLATRIVKFGDVDRIWLLFIPPRCRKPLRFMLNVGRMRGKRLDQAQFGSETDNTDAYKVLKGIAAELKRRTTAGIWVVNANGNMGYTKLFRISAGAAEASRNGEVELVMGGTTQSFYADEPQRLDT